MYDFISFLVTLHRRKFSMPMIRIEQYDSSDKLPKLISGFFFHSEHFFRILEKSSGIKPIMFVAYDEYGEIGHMLTMLKRDLRIIPPGVYHWCSIYGEGTYRDDCKDCNEIFSVFLKKLKEKLDIRYIFIEARYIADSRITYRTFSEHGFVPKRDLRIYNSLHNRHPEERLSRAYKTHIRRAEARGVTYRQATSEEEISKGLELMKNYYASKIKRYLAPIKLFQYMITDKRQETPDIRMFTVYNKEKRMIGCSICLYSDERAYLLYNCGLRKRYPLLYPGIISVWAAIKDAFQRGYSHFEFSVSGIPLNKHIGYKNFILNFGGKQVSTLRWYRFRWDRINKILRKIYV